MEISSNILTIGFYSAAGLAIILLVYVATLHAKLSRFTRGKNGHTLEDGIVAMQKELDHQKHFEKQTISYLSKLENRMSRAIRGVHAVRFNAFKGTGSGGNQSFATAYINEKGDGVVISTLSARERVSVFAKPVKNFTSEYELLPEEQEAIDEARKNLSL